MWKGLVFIPFIIPMILGAGSWLWTRNRKLAYRIIFVAIAILVSLPVGAALIATLIGLLDGWTFIFDAGHNPGIGIAFLPLIMSWFVCVLLWFIATVFALANKAIKSRTVSNRH